MKPLLAIVYFAGGKDRLEYPIGKALYHPAGWITYARVSPHGDRIALGQPQGRDQGCRRFGRGRDVPAG